jgi:hypothetical protein
VDTAAGGNDRVAGQFMSHRWLDVPEILHAHVTITAVTPLIHEELLSIYKQTSIRPIVCYERNNGGAFELERLSRLNRHGDYRIYTMQRLDSSGHLTDSGVMGWDTNTATRPKMLQELDDGLNSRLLHLYDRQTINEMFSFIVNPKNGKAEAEEGAHDDLVMSLAGVWQMYQTEKPEEDEQGGSVVETSPTGYNMRTVIDEALESSIVNVGDM